MATKPPTSPCLDSNITLSPSLLRSSAGSAPGRGAQEAVATDEARLDAVARLQVAHQGPGAAGTMGQEKRPLYGGKTWEKRGKQYTQKRCLQNGTTSSWWDRIVGKTWNNHKKRTTWRGKILERPMFSIMYLERWWVLQVMKRENSDGKPAKTIGKNGWNMMKPQCLDLSLVSQNVYRSGRWYDVLVGDVDLKLWS